MRTSAGSGRREGYATAMAGLWSDLSRTLTELEAVAAEPEERLADDEALDHLPRLQYALHRLGELVVGIEPPPGAETAHAELVAALADARDATADVVEAVDLGGPTAAAQLRHEWRGALFGVRLARLRLAGRADRRSGLEPARSFPLVPALSVALVLLGTVAFAAGATIASWPLWTGGLLLLAAGFVVYRP